MSECIAGQTYTFRISVYDEADPTVAKNNPTIGASDFLISINDGTDQALTNTPTVINSSRVIRVILSAAETTAAGANGSIVLKVADASASDGWLGGDVEIKVRGYATATSNDVATITAALTTIDDFLDTEIAAILAKVNALPVDPADASDIAASFTTLTNKLTAYVQLLARKDAGIATTNATEVTAINAGGGTFSNQTDSIEALRDRGDAAWITATGFSTAAALTTVDSNVAAIKAKTDNLPASPASTTNITAGTITTVTNLTNAPTSGDLTATMKASVTAAATAATPTVAAVTGNVGGNVVGSVASVVAGVGLADNAITAAKIAQNAIDADALAADALAEIVASILAEVLESGKTVKQTILDLWSVTVGDASANSATEPTSITYDSPDGSVQVTHTLTSTTRAVS